MMDVKEIKDIQECEIRLEYPGKINFILNNQLNFKSKKAKEILEPLLLQIGKINDKAVSEGNTSFMINKTFSRIFKHSSGAFYEFFNEFNVKKQIGHITVKMFFGKIIKDSGV